jgi:hypothetical protein
MSTHLPADLKANYERFIERVRSTHMVWGLKDEGGWAVCPSNEYECDVYVFWSDEAYARQHCTDDWSGYQPESIELESFLEDWLPGMEHDGYLVGVQFNADLAGLEVEPAELALELSE